MDKAGQYREGAEGMGKGSWRSRGGLDGGGGRRGWHWSQGWLSQVKLRTDSPVAGGTKGRRRPTWELGNRQVG